MNDDHAQEFATGEQLAEEGPVGESADRETATPFPAASATESDVQAAGPSSSDAAGDVSTLVGLMEHAYAQGGKQVHIKAATAKALGDEPDGRPDVVRDLVDRLSKTDPLISVPPRLLAGLERSAATRRVTERVLWAVAPAVADHPALESVPVSTAFGSEREDDGSSLLEEAELAIRSVALEALGDPPEDMAPELRRELRDNVLTTLVLVLSLRNRWKPSLTIRQLDRWVWQQQLVRAPSPPSVGQLAETRSPEMLALVGRAYGDQVRALTSEVARWQEEVRIADASVRLAREDKRAWEHRHAGLAAELERLQGAKANADAELADALEQVRVKGMHAVDDYELLRTKVVRSLRESTGMLEDALHALRNGRLAVTEEFVERVLVDLRRDLGQIEM